MPEAGTYVCICTCYVHAYMVLEKHSCLKVTIKLHILNNI